MNVWEVCEFTDEIKFGKLDRKMFAVELYEVLSGHASEIYQDPEKFLDYTFLTSDMRRLLTYILKRLAKNEGNAVYVLDTEFGGGKTHSLLLLYHIFRNRELGNKYIREYNIDKESNILEIPSVKVIAIDCRRMEKETLWGQLAYEAGKYDLMRENDIRKIPPINIDVIKSLFDQPTLILIDELPAYLLTASAHRIGDTNLMELTLNFLTMLISAVSTGDRVALVITLTGRQSLYERYVEEVKRRLKEAEIGKAIEGVQDYYRSSVSRQAQYLVPVRDIEIYEVIRKRLIKTIKERDAQRIVDRYFNYYLDKGLIEDHEYKRKMEMAYPFHPSLIDILHYRVSTIEKFNRTRGALWLLATILHRIYRNRVECDLVTTGDVQIDDPTIKDALTAQLDKSEYINVVNTDVIEKANELDRGRNIKIVGRIARTIFLHSLIASAKISGIRPTEIKLAVCRPGEDTSIVDEALRDMDREFWYLRSNGGREYYFWISPGINKVIYDYKKEVSEGEVEDKILKTLNKLFKPISGFKIVWDPDKLDDDKENIRIFVSLKPLDKAKLEKLFDILPNGNPREYKNTLLFVYPDREPLKDVWKDARELAAIEKAMTDDRIKQDRGKIRELKDRKEEAEANLAASCEIAYSLIAYPKVGDGELVIEEIHPIFEARKSRDLTERLIKHLEYKMKLRESLNPDSFMDINSIKSELVKRGYIKVSKIYDIFRKDRMLPYIKSGEAIVDAVRKGVEKSLFGYSDILEDIDGKYKAKIGTLVNVKWDGYIIKRDYIYSETETRKEVEHKPIREDSIDVIIPTYRPRRFSRVISISGFSQLKDILNKAIILKTLGNIDMKLSIRLSMEGDEVEILSRLKNVSRLKELIEHLELHYRDAEVNGGIEIESDEDISDELRKYGLEEVKR